MRMRPFLRAWRIVRLIARKFPVSQHSTALLLVGCVSTRIKPGRLVRDPGDEGRDLPVAAQGVPGMVSLQQFALGQRRMNLAVADLVDRELLLALEGFRDQVVAVDIGRSQDPSA